MGRLFASYWHRFEADAIDLHAGRRIQPEISAAYLLTRQLAAGAEWRRKPHNLGVDNEKNYYDVFVACFPNRNLSLTGAYANLGGQLVWRLLA